MLFRWWSLLAGRSCCRWAALPSGGLVYGFLQIGCAGIAYLDRAVGEYQSRRGGDTACLREGPIVL